MMRSNGRLFLLIRLFFSRKLLIIPFRPFDFFSFLPFGLQGTNFRPFDFLLIRIEFSALQLFDLPSLGILLHVPVSRFYTFNYQTFLPFDFQLFGPVWKPSDIVPTNGLSFDHSTFFQHELRAFSFLTFRPFNIFSFLSFHHQLFCSSDL